MRNYQKLIVKNKRKKMPKCSSTITHFTGVDNSISPSKYKQYQIQWTLSIITTLYLQLLSISNKKLGPLDICVLSKLFLSLYLELLYLEQKSWSLATISRLRVRLHSKQNKNAQYLKTPMQSKRLNFDNLISTKILQSVKALF